MNVVETLEAGSWLLGATLVFFLPLEILERRRSKRLTREALVEMAASASPLIPTLLTAATALAFASTILTWASRSALTAIPTTWGSAAVCFVLVDLLAYVEHVVAHKVRIYWAVGHSVHHSSRQFDQTTALRVSFVDGFTVPFALLPAAFVGFDPALVLACFAVTVAYQQWIHTELVGSLGVFDLVFNSPANHRVHHGATADCIDRNFGSVLMIWDHLFGTYQPEGRREAPIRYGIVHPVTSANPWTVHTAELERLIRDLQWPSTK